MLRQVDVVAPDLQALCLEKVFLSVLDHWLSEWDNNNNNNNSSSKIESVNPSYVLFLSLLVSTVIIFTYITVCYY